MRILITEGQLRHITEMSVKAFHGTPHKFDRFSTEKVGTGESTQWFGWGLYFTDDESIANWYSRAVRELKNKDFEQKKIQLYFKDKLIFDGEPTFVVRKSFWPVMSNFNEINGLPLEVITSLPFEKFLEYKRQELNGKVPSFPWFDRDKFIYEFNSKFQSARNRVGWSPKAYKDERGDWKVPQYDENDKFILKHVKLWNEKNQNKLTPKEYIEKFYTNTSFWGWDIIRLDNGQINLRNEKVNFDYLSDEKMEEYKDILLRIYESIKPEDLILKKPDPLFSKSNIYNVTLHKGKTPDEYEYLDWYGKLTPRQKEKILNRLKERGYTSRKFVKVVNSDDDNIDAVKPKFFDNVRDAKSYMVNRNIKANLMGHAYKGFIGSLKIEKDGFNIKTDLDGDVKDFYTKLCGLVGSDKNASLFLLSAGIDGIKYPTNTISGGESKGYNYVVFDEKSINIDKVDEKD